MTRLDRRKAAFKFLRLAITVRSWKLGPNPNSCKVVLPRTPDTTPPWPLHIPSELLIVCFHTRTLVVWLSLPPTRAKLIYSAQRYLARVPRRLLRWRGIGMRGHSRRDFVPAPSSPSPSVGATGRMLFVLPYPWCIVAHVCITTLFLDGFAVPLRSVANYVLSCYRPRKKFTTSNNRGCIWPRTSTTTSTTS